MDKYNKARIKLALLYFGIIFILVVFFSIFAVQINNSQYARFENQDDFQEMINSRLRMVPPQYRDEFIKRENERNDEIQKAISDSKKEFLVELIAMDIFLLLATGIASVWLSHETLLPIIEAYKRQKKFVADASHELRTPIAAMKSETDVILRSKKATEQDYKETLVSVNEELDTLTNLSTYLLEIARSDEQKMTLDLTHFDLSELFEETSKKFEKIAKRNNLSFEKEIVENIKISADKQRIEQLLRILFDNAVKYNKPDGTIRLSLNQIDNKAILEVSDTGVGIPKVHLDKIFDRFYRVTEDRHQKGFGLGLTIAKQIVSEHSGFIKVESKENEWTKFIIQLPIQHSPQN